MTDAEWMTPPLELEDLSFTPESLTCFTGWGSLQNKKGSYVMFLKSPQRIANINKIPA